MTIELKDVSEWTIWIDDVEGELAMDSRDCRGRNIEVIAKEEIEPIITRLQAENKLLREELEKEKGVVEFYAATSSWGGDDRLGSDIDESDTQYFNKWFESIGGKRARQRKVERKTI